MRARFNLKLILVHALHCMACETNSTEPFQRTKYLSNERTSSHLI